MKRSCTIPESLAHTSRTLRFDNVSTGLLVARRGQIGSCIMGSLGVPSREQYDVLIIGAGLSGVCTLHHLKQRFSSWRIQVLEAGTGSGGTWFWNTYPGACTDGEASIYLLNFAPELLEEWDFRNRYPKQHEIQTYLGRVVGECLNHIKSTVRALLTKIRSIWLA